MNTTANSTQTAPTPTCTLVKPFRFPQQPHEYKIVALRECPTPEELQLCEQPEQVVSYWNTHVISHPHFNPDCECLVTLILNTRRRIKGHYLVTIGTMDTLLVHAREVYRLALMAGASAIIIAHNHPSGESSPSNADINVTRDLIRAGQLLKIELLDHVIIGRPGFTSLKAIGFFHS